LSIISYDNLNNIAETSFVAGSDQVWTFTCYNTDGATLLDITSGSVTWYLCPYGEPSIITLQKSGYIVTNHTFTVTLTATDTIDLDGKYLQQVSVTDYSGNTFRPGQGIVIVVPAITT